MNQKGYKEKNCPQNSSILKKCKGMIKKYKRNILVRAFSIFPAGNHFVESSNASLDTHIDSLTSPMVTVAISFVLRMGGQARFLITSMDMKQSL